MSSAEETEENIVKEEGEAEETKGKIESRLAFLAKMYETKKAKRAEEETMADDEAAEE